MHNIKSKSSEERNRRTPNWAWRVGVALVAVNTLVLIFSCSPNVAAIAGVFMGGYMMGESDS